MLGDFTYCNPTKLYFGEHALEHLPEELKKYGNNVVLVYGGGSIKKNGIYDDVMKVLKASGKTVTEVSGVMPNPTVAKLNEGVQIARDAKADFILAVGGGSVIDYSKALSVSVNYDGDPWEKYYLKFEEPDCEMLPVGAVLTMVGTGSEMNCKLYTLVSVTYQLHMPYRSSQSNVSVVCIPASADLPQRFYADSIQKESVRSVPADVMAS